MAEADLEAADEVWEALPLLEATFAESLAAAVVEAAPVLLAAAAGVDEPALDSDAAAST